MGSASAGTHGSGTHGSGCAPDPAPQADPAFPRLHIRPAAGWLNDPNGLACVDGVYHVFFQYNPGSARHERIGWGHWSSTDLVSWAEEPLALAPRPGRADSFGCWSGCVTIVDGVPTAIYSGAVREGGDSSVLLAESDRAMRVWRQGEQPVARTPAGLAEMRDPFVVEADGRRWAVQCAVLDSGECSVVVHSCDDVRRWQYRGPLLTRCGLALAQEIVPAAVWECPQLCRIDGRWVLILSPLAGVPGASPEPGPVGWLIGDLSVTEGCLRFEPHAGGLVDLEPAFYAPQVLALPDRVLMWGWIREHGRAQEELDTVGWAGVVSFPRELRLAQGRLVSSPARELAGLRQAAIHDGPVPDGGLVLTEAAFEVELGSEQRAAGEVGSEAGSEVHLELLDADGVRLHVLRVPVPEGAGLRVLVDGSVIEAFGESGPTASDLTSTHRAYPAPTGAVWVVRAAGSLAGSPSGSPSLRVWRLGLGGVDGPPREIGARDVRHAGAGGCSLCS